MGQKHSKEKNIQRIQANGHKIRPEETLNAWKVPATSEFPVPGGRPDYMWVETGGSRAGFQHMQAKGRSQQFEQAGIPQAEQREKLPILAEAHTTVGRYIGEQGKDRPIMATHIDGRVHRNAITVGSNGYVVSMNPVSSGKLKLKPGNPGVPRTDLRQGKAKGCDR
ncbi:hypothetical protein C8A00DRAFT_34666 [Chaetomidium leptoderma]|uniref:Uncharacterized protein n=1 Tax=Chaetomidium leptoderma TaxID=669021 RepID=A0AAN6VKT2_9PEZI|nr:hypothetical protein C8A00DRAFT_34666 [Chaetomidium leptoderma]